MAKITREIFEIIKLINTVEYQNTRSDNTLLNIISIKIINIKMTKNQLKGKIIQFMN